MKNIQYILVLIFVGSFYSCGDSFLETIPEFEGDIQTAVVDAESARSFLNSSYDALTYSSVLGGQYQLISELMSDGLNGNEGNLVTNGDWRAHYTWTTDIFLGTTRSMMHDGYKAIGRGNNLLGILEGAEFLDATEKDLFEGEIKFIRALMHFELVRFFAQPYGYTSNNDHLGIPIRTAYNTDVLPRSTVGEVYAQIIADLESAAALLPNTNGAYANAYSAKALLARVYFQMNESSLAYTLADEVITSSGMTLDSSFVTKFDGSDASNEILFGLVSTDYFVDNANGGFADYFRLDVSTNTAALYPSAEYLGSFEPGDERLSTWFLEEGDLTFCNKFNVESQVLYTNPIIHLTEMKLIRAESAALLNENLETAAQDISDIRERAGLNAISPSSSANQLINIARSERRKELFFENNRLHDLKRQALADGSNLLIRNEAPWDCPGMICQFPDNELKGNPDLVPNESGGCN